MNNISNAKQRNMRFRLSIYEDVNGDGNYLPFDEGYLANDGAESDTLEEMSRIIADDLLEWGCEPPKRIRFRKVMNPVPMFVYHSPSKALMYQVNLVVPSDGSVMAA